MSPKKAIIIILILALFVVAIFTFFYIKQQLTSQQNQPLDSQSGLNNSDQQSQEQAVEPAKIIEDKVQRIIEEAKTNPTSSSPEAVRQEIINTINQEIIKQEENKTPEQKAADAQAQAERQKIIDQINAQIKQNSAK